MAQIHTHYDNLKVARNAPPEVIRAAYKTLAQKIHPDRNPGNAEATRIMAVINASYEVLSDPDKRREHDLWIAQQERTSAHVTKPDNQVQQSNTLMRQNCPSCARETEHDAKGYCVVCGRDAAASALYLKLHKKRTWSASVIAHVLRNWLQYLIVAFFVWLWAADKPSTPPPGSKPYQANPAPVRPEYVRPSAAPNGQLWPDSASYVSGYKSLHVGGLSTVTVDNSRNDSDVFVKLVSLDGVQAYPVRQFYIPAFGSFTLNKITAGSYDIRYRDLGNGGLSRSEAFNLEEIQTYDGVQYSNITMTLYKVQNGNMQTYGLSEAEF